MSGFLLQLVVSVMQAGIVALRWCSCYLYLLSAPTCLSNHGTAYSWKVGSAKGRSCDDEMSHCAHFRPWFEGETLDSRGIIEDNFTKIHSFYKLKWGFELGG